MKAFYTRVFFQHLAFGMMIPASVLWQLERGLTLGQISIIVSLWWVSVFLFEVPSGMLADRFGRKNVLALSALLFVLGFGGTGLATTFTTFVIVKVLTGIAFAMLSGADEAYVFDFLKSHKKERDYKKVWSRVYIVDEVATIFGALLGAAIIYMTGLQNVFFVGGVILILVVMITLFALRDIVHDQNPDNSEEEVEKHPKRVLTRAWQLVGRYHFLVWAFLVFALVNFRAEVLWEPHMVNVGLTVAQVSLAYGFLKLFSVAGSIVAGRHKGEMTGRHFALLALGMAICFSLIATSFLWLTLLGFGLFFFFENIFRIFKSEFINQRIGSTHRATVLSAAGFTASIFGAAVVIPIGYLGDFSLVYAFMVMVAVKVVASLLALVTMRRRE